MMTQIRNITTKSSTITFFQMGPGSHPASYKMALGIFSGGKEAGAWR